MTCRSYCQHGGVCVLEEGHEGLHDSEWCTWSNEEAIPKDEADRLYLEKAGNDPLARMIADWS